jgi:hypothetical protein
MRHACGALLFLTLGCASTVTRLDGEFPAPIGPARSPCERADWLVVAPTRVQLIEPVGLRSTPRDDGVALYRVGALRPQPIATHADTMRQQIPTVDEHIARVRVYDTKTWTAAGLGAAGLIAIGVGAALFASAFKTDPTTQKQKIDGAEAGLGSGLVLGGFGLGIAGLVVNPGQVERSRAEAARYTFLPPRDPRDAVVTWTQSYNQAVRDRCGRAASP